MGLAASQARLLSITQRISDNELRAQLINNQKMRLNSESSRVSENYINALNKTNLVFANYDSEDNAQNVPLTFNNLTAFNQYNNQYNLTNVAGNVLISESDAEKYIASKGNLEAFLSEYDLVYTTSYWDTIGNQLHKCEAFYSNPNQNDSVGNVTAIKNASEQIIGYNSDEDGVYSFFFADQLKEMYEGSPEKNMPSYAETVKTWQYNDFIKAYDIWNDTIAAFRKEQQARNVAIEKASAQIIANNGNIITSGDITVNADGTFDTDKTLTLNHLKKDGNAAVVNLKDYLPANIEALGFTKNGTNYEKDQDWNSILDTQNGHAINTVKTTTLDDNTHNALYLETGGKTYVQINAQEDASTTTDNGDGTSTTTVKTVSYWLNTSDNTIYTFDGSELKAETYPVTADITDENGNKTGTSETTIVAEWDNEQKIATWTMSGIVKDLAGNETDREDSFNFAQYPNSTATNTTQKLSLDITKDSSIKIIQDTVASKMNNEAISKIIEKLINDGYKINNEGGSGNNDDLSLTDKELEMINTPTETNTQLTALITQLKELLGINVEVSADEMDEILISLTSGTNLTPGENNYTLRYGVGGSKNIPIPKTSMALINALVCDTMMDYFGEPIYGYMKMNGSGEYVVADEEAKWYTNLFEKIQSCGYQVLAKGLANSTDWMQFALENGIVVMEQINEEQNWQPITHTSCSDIIEQTDSQAATLAEAEYNKAMRQIEAKDEMFDLELKNIDTEHASLESEYESVKKAMTGNIERTFQMYG